jgi:hypothetical protein
MSSVKTLFRFLYRATNKAKPTATSAAATCHDKENKNTSIQIQGRTRKIYQREINAIQHQF